MKITVFGTGYVGLVTGACLSDAGHDVICVDIDQEKIDNLNMGIVSIYEPGLSELVTNNLKAGRLRFTLDSTSAIHFADLVFIAVGTPEDEDGSADLKYVAEVARTISLVMVEPKVIINKSTVPVGTADTVDEIIRRGLENRGLDIDYSVCSNPEFLKEGSAIDDFTKASRIIIGSDSNWVRQQMVECYSPYNRNHNKIIFMDRKSAEFTKYAANAMLATKISFMNELSSLAELLNVDIENVRNGIGSDPRIGYQFIYPGCGYGGSCFPKDVKALIKTGESVDFDMKLIKSVDFVNNRQKMTLFNKLNYALSGKISGATIAVWGLSFKPNTDDMREAPSLSLISSILEAGGAVIAYDPEANKEAQRIFGDSDRCRFVNSKEDAVIGAEALVICTEWNVFRSVDLKWLKRQLLNPIVVDGRNLYNPDSLAKHGLKYYAVGRGDSLCVVDHK